MTILAVFGPSSGAAQALEIIGQFYAVGIPALTLFLIGGLMLSRRCGGGS